MNIVFFIFELIGTVAFALSGALTAIKKDMDIFGACVLGMTTAIGGGIMRDILLGVFPPSALVDPLHAFVALAVSALTYLPPIQAYLSKKHRNYDFFMLIADAVGLGVFTVIGAMAAFTYIGAPNLFTSVLLGVITGVGGGVMRDVFSKDVPKIFVKNFYACASAVGALLFSLVYPYLHTILSLSLGIVAVLTLRLLAATFRWDLPKPRHTPKKENDAEAVKEEWVIK